MKKEMVLGFAFSRNAADVILMKKNRPEWQKGMYNGVGGGIEEGETPEDAMYREFEEETGVKIQRRTEEERKKDIHHPNKPASSEWKLFAIMEGSDWKVYCFSCFTNAIYQCKTTTDEEVVNWATSSIPEQNVIPNLKWLVPLALDNYPTIVEIKYP